MRKSWGVNEPQVLVSFVKPKKTLFSSTMSRWLKQILEVESIDTGSFKGHSTRAAASTWADVPWLTFHKFYKK